MVGLVRVLCSFILAAAILDVPTASADAFPKQDPSHFIHSRNGDSAPLWVSAKAATTPGGGIDWDLLGERARVIYQSVVQNVPRLMVEEPGSQPKYDPDSSGLRPECVYYGSAHFDYVNPPSDETLADVIKNAQAVMRGRITEITPGFYLGEPNSLLTVSVDRKIRSSRHFSVGNSFYIVYPKARFNIGDTNFCKHDSRFPYSPQVGDQVLILPFQGPQGEGFRLIQPGPVELIFETEQGELILPKKFVSTASAEKFTSLRDIEVKMLASD